MTLADHRTRRMVVDLQACQSDGSARRGVGRYSRSLFDSLRAQAQGWDVHALVSDALGHSITPEGLAPSRLHRLRGLPDWGTGRGHNGGAQDALDALAHGALVGAIDADLLHVSNVFEGFRERLPLPAPVHRAPGQVISATLYDLIPLLFKSHYLQAPEALRWYQSRLAWLRQADLLLAISEATRRDAIEQIGIAPERVVTVHGGIDACFQASAAGRDAAVLQRWGIRQRYVLYTGGDDHRKNVRGAVAGYAAVPAAQRADCQFVVVCAMGEDSRDRYLQFARECGLGPGELLLVGYVPEDDLVRLYQGCDAFIFPSLYEGLGLPVLEAMACGAPVVGADNSSIREIIGRPDALFDAGSRSAIAGALSRVLTQRGFADSLRRWGPGRAAQFNWRDTGRRSLEAMQEASTRATHAGVAVAVNGWLPRGRMAMLTPLPPAKSGIADYNAQFLPFLARHHEIDLFVDGYEVTDPALQACHRILPVEAFDQLAPNYDHILYEFGNSEFHEHMRERLARHPGVVGMHDAYLSGLMGYREFYLRDAPGSYARDMLDAHASLARRFLAPAMADPDPVGHSMAALPGNRRLFEQAVGVISHTPYNLQVQQDFYPEGVPAPHRMIPQMFPLPPLSAGDRAQARSALGLLEDTVMIATFGHIVWTKAGDQLLEAFEQSLSGQDERVRLVYAGEMAGDDFGRRLQARIAASPLASRVIVTGYLDHAAYRQHLLAADIVIQLRIFNRGSTSRAVLECLAHGLPVIVNDDASFRDYADDVVAKVPATPTVAQIAERIDALAGDAALRGVYGAAGRAHVADHHDPATCAAQYAATLHAFRERWRRRQPVWWAERMAPHLAACDDPAAASQRALAWLQGQAGPRLQRRRVLIDCTEVIAGSEGRHREAVASLMRGLYSSSSPGHEPWAVQRLAGSLHLAKGWLGTLGLLLPQERQQALPSQVQLQAGDTVVVLAPARQVSEEALALLAQASGLEARVGLVLLGPLEPANMDVALAIAGDTEGQDQLADPLDWIVAAGAGIARHCDFVLCASHADAARLAALLPAREGHRGRHIAVWQPRQDDGASADTLLQGLLDDAWPPLSPTATVQPPSP